MAGSINDDMACRVWPESQNYFHPDIKPAIVVHLNKSPFPNSIHASWGQIVCVGGHRWCTAPLLGRLRYDRCPIFVIRDLSRLPRREYVHLA